MDELKPCPFCGGGVSMTYNGFEKAYFVYHCFWKYETGQCAFNEPFAIDGEKCKSREEAIEAWNRRASNES